MKKTKNSFRNKLMKKTTFTTAILVAFLFIGSSAANIVGNVTEEIENNEEMSYLMAPATNQLQSVPSGSQGRGETIYAQHTSTDDYVWFDTDTPSSYNIIAPTGFTAFPQGACYVDDVQWTTDTDGNIFTIDPATGVMTSVGNAGVPDGLVALFYNPSDGTLYGGSITDLYTIDQGTGAATLVGSYGSVGGSGWLISLDCDNAGNTYGYNIDNAANAILYSVNLGTGAATQIGSLGFPTNYGQDMVYDKNNDVLYACAYHASSGARFGTIDTSTGLFTLLSSLPGQTTCAAMEYDYVFPDHDVGVKSINVPANGDAQEIYTPEVTVKNFGNNSEVTDVQMTISQGVPDVDYLTEDFTTFPPVGWTTNTWIQSPSNIAGGVAPEAYIDYTIAFNYDYLNSAPVNTLAATNLELEFKMYAQHYSNAFDIHVWSRADATDTWTENALWNPITANIGPGTFVFDISHDIGSATEISFEFEGVPWDFDYIFIDDVRIYEPGTFTLLYDETVTGVSLSVGEEVDVTFPDWTDPNWQAVSNVYIDYDVFATTLLADNDSTNDAKAGTVTLYYGYLHDIEVVSIDSPPLDEVLPADTFPVEMTIKNNGQFTEGCFVGAMTIDKKLTPTQIMEESFEDYIPGGYVDWDLSDAHWSTVTTSYAGIAAPELRFYWSPSQTGDFRAYPLTPIDTTGYTSLNFSFWHYVNDYSGGYTLKVETSTDAVNWNTVWSISPTGSIPATNVQFDITNSDVGSDTFYFCFTYSGNSFNINYWYIDDIDLEFGLYTEDFSGAPESGWPPAGWYQEQVVGTDPDNFWEPADAARYTTPSCDPYDGDWMIFVDHSYVLTGDAVRLVTEPYDFAAAGFSVYELKFYMYHSNSYNYGATLDIQVSTDASTWTTVDTFTQYDPTNPGWVQEVVDLTAYAAESTVYIGWLNTDGTGFDDIIVDLITIDGLGVVPDYYDDENYFYIDPGEELTLTLDDWTPLDLALMMSGSYEYVVSATHDLATDENPANDALFGTLTLEYFHDVEVTDITSPSDKSRETFIGYNDGYTENSLGLTAGGDITMAITLTDTELAPYRGDDITQIYMSVGNDELGFDIANYDIWIEPGLPDYNDVYTGGVNIVQSGTSSGVDWDLVDIPAYTIPSTGDVTIGVNFMGTASGVYPCGIDETNTQPAPRANHITYNGFGQWSDLVAIGFPGVWGLDAGILGGGGPGAADIYLAPGSQAFAAMMKNSGVFPETGLDATAVLSAFNETGIPYTIYEGNYTDFDLDVGEEEEATFGSFTFVDADIYELVINLPLLTDDFPGNNFQSLFIGIDDTAPSSDHALDPAAPTGANGWYVSDCTVTLTADDGSEGWQSGVDFIEYRIDGGAWQTGDTFVISTNGMHTIEYRATDNVGNVEDPNSFDLDMDQDGPTIDLTWEAGSAKNEIIFTATCSDADSGMDYVEFYINDVLQTTATSAPYTFTMVHGQGTKYTVKAIAYDLAGNTDFDEIGSGEGLNNVNVQTTPNPLIK